MSQYDDDALRFGEDDWYEGIGEAQCKFCGMQNLMWERGVDERNVKRWGLIEEDGAAHNCRANPVPLNSFPITP